MLCSSVYSIRYPKAQMRSLKSLSRLKLSIQEFSENQKQQTCHFRCSPHYDALNWNVLMKFNFGIWRFDHSLTSTQWSEIVQAAAPQQDLKVLTSIKL